MGQCEKIERVAKPTRKENTTLTPGAAGDPHRQIFLSARAVSQVNFKIKVSQVNFKRHITIL